MNSDTTYIYRAKVGAFGGVAFLKDPTSKTYCFSFFNGADYTPLYLSEDAVYYVWAFIGCEHPDCLCVGVDQDKYPASKTNVKNFTTVKKAGRGKPKKQPSKPTKKKAKSK